MGSCPKFCLTLFHSPTTLCWCTWASLLGCCLLLNFFSSRPHCMNSSQVPLQDSLLTCLRSYPPREPRGSSYKIFCYTARQCWGIYWASTIFNNQFHLNQDVLEIVQLGFEVWIQTAVADSRGPYWPSLSMTSESTSQNQQHGLQGFFPV